MDETGASRFDRRSVLVGVLLAGVILLAARFRGLSDQAICHYDESLYLVQGMSWVQGLLPGRDTWVNKPPLLPWLFAASDWLFGATTLPPRIMCFLALLGSAGLAAGLVRRRGRFAPIAAAVAVAVLGSTRMPAFEVEAGLSEPLFVLPLTLAFFVALRAPAGALASGGAAALLGVATLLRQNGLIFEPLLFLIVMARGPRPPWPKLIARAAAYAAGTLLPFVPFVVYFHLQGGLAEVWASSWTGPAELHIVSPKRLWLPGSIFIGTFLGHHLVWTALGAVGLAACAVAFCAKRDALEHAALPAWVFFSMCSCVVGGRYYDHYLPMLAPALATVVGVGVGALEGLAARRGPRVRTAILTLVVAAVAADALVATVGMAWQGAALFPYENTAVAAQGPLLARIRALTRAEDRIFFIGSCPGLYFRSERAPATPDLAGETIYFCRFYEQLRRRTVHLPDGRSLALEDYLAERLATATVVLLPVMPPKGCRWFSGQSGEYWNPDEGSVPQVPAFVRCLAEKFRPLPETIESVRVYVRAGP